MTHYTWIKLYIEMLDDPKTGTMPDWLFRRFVQYLLVARERNQDGLLGPVSDLAWRLRSSEDDMLKALRPMSEIGIVAETPDGWLVVNFLKRQAPATPAERSAQYRKRERNEEETKRDDNRHENETEEDIDSISISTSISDSVSSSDSIFEASFRSFNGDREKKRWYALVEAIGVSKAKQIAAWAEKKEIHMTNRGGLLDSMETAAKTWGEKNGSKKPGALLSGSEIKAKVAAFMGEG